MLRRPTEEEELAMMIGLRTPGLREIAVLGARCGDIASGLGGTLLTLTAGRALSLRIHALVLSGADTHHEVEEHRILSALCGTAELDVRVLEVPSTRAGGPSSETVSALEELRYRCEPDVVYGPHRADRGAVPGFSEFAGIADLSEDSCLAEHMAQVFRDHLVLGYETPRRPAPAAATTLFHALTPEDARRKARILDPDTSDGLDPAQHAAHLALARLRGAQCGSPFAEVFLAEKIVLPDESAQPPAVGIYETGLPR